MQHFLKNLEGLTFFRGRVALYAILHGLGIGKGDQVVTQAFTCVAVPEAIMASGALPIYTDIEPNGFNMEASDLECKITPQTRAIIVQHTFGIPADMERIKYIADKANIPIIEDCCHTFASVYRGKTVGTFGVGSFYSFEWGKPIVVGIGGGAVLNNIILYEKVKSIYRECRFPSVLKLIRIQLQYLGFKALYRPAFYWPVRNLFHLLGSIGVTESNYNPIRENKISKDFSSKMPKILQKRLLHKLQSLDEYTRHTRWVVNEYELKINSSLVSPPKLPANTEAVFARYPLIAKNKSTLLEQASKANVELADWYSSPIHPLSSKDLHIVFYENDSCPNAEKRCKQVVTLPTHTSVKRRDINRVAEFLNTISI